VVALALAGERAARAWRAASAAVDVYDVKGLVEHVLQALGVSATSGRGSGSACFEPDCQGRFVAGETTVAEFGEVTEAAREVFKIRPSVFAAFVWLDAVATLPRAVPRYEPLPRFPSVQRDVAFLSPSAPAFTVHEVEDAIRGHAGPLLREVVLFDFFPLETGGRSLAWRLTFQAEDRTLTDEEVNRQTAAVVEAVCRRFPVTLRS
jgi:phenylalanyl-tRNA synthetase beta chain